ncbi:hypothetical protein HWHPT5561_08950, partial [Petrotoga sp. HWH.PT.55.6.1]
ASFIKGFTPQTYLKQKFIFLKELGLLKNANFNNSFIHQRCIYYHISLHFVNFFFMNLFENYCELIILSKVSFRKH